MNFTFRTAENIIFGNNESKKIPDICKTLGSRVLFVTGKRDIHIKSLSPEFEARGISVVPFHVEKEPTVEMIETGLELARNEKCDIVVAVGGGSVIDAGKALAGLIPNEGRLLDYLEVIGDAKPLLLPKVPLIAVPTTAGTGAEVTCNSVIASKKHSVKVSLRSVHLYPTCAVIDPVLTIPLSREMTALTGFDAVTQLIESYISNMATPFTDALCIEGIKRCIKSFLAAYQEGTNLQARENMCIASHFSGIALANSRLGAVHGIAGPLGGMIQAPHGGICAALLLPVMKKNSIQIRKQKLNSVMSKLTEIDKLFHGREGNSFQGIIEWIGSMAEKMNIHRLGYYGFEQRHFKELAQKAMRASSMKGNPVLFTEQDLFDIFNAAL